MSLEIFADPGFHQGWMIIVETSRDCLRKKNILLNQLWHYLSVCHKLYLLVVFNLFYRMLSGDDDDVDASLSGVLKQVTNCLFTNKLYIHLSEPPKYNRFRLCQIPVPNKQLTFKRSTTIGPWGRLTLYSRRSSGRRWGRSWRRWWWRRKSGDRTYPWSEGRPGRWRRTLDANQ